MWSRERILRWRWLSVVVAIITLPGPGCARYQPTPAANIGIDTSHYEAMGRKIEYPKIEKVSDEQILEATSAPISLSSETPTEYLDLSLEEVMRLGLAQSKAFRDLGGLVLRSPEIVRTKNDPAIAQTDPRFGIEAALSAFDAQVAASAMWEKNDRALNNQFFGGGTRLLTQDFNVYQAQISKTAATGSNFAIRNYTQYDANNAPGNFFPSAWTTWYEGEVRQPLLQGAGVDFNRIAGPNAQPGLINGVVIARINSDISLADFEVGVRNYVSDVENCYWDLSFAWRDLESKIAARDAALETWRRIRALYEQGRRGGEAEKEAQAREQYFRFQEEAQNALHGRLLDGTRTNNGSTGGTFRGTGGVFVCERRLRLLIGMPINDGRLIRTADEPSAAKLSYSWESTLGEALSRRVELRRQKWQVRKRELELQANKNFLKPQLDAMARYRFRGFGKDLLPDGTGGEFGDAYSNLTSGNFQEWQLGLEFSMPLGFRQAYTAVRNAELQLARDRALLFEQERSVIHDLSNAIADVDRSYQIVETALNRRMAAREQVEAVQAAFDADNATVDLLLEAQRRMADADISYFRAVIEYSLSIKNVQLEKGTLFDYNEISLEEGPWPEQAYCDALERQLRTHPASRFDHPKQLAPQVSEGPMIQTLAPALNEPQGMTYPPVEGGSVLYDDQAIDAPGSPEATQLFDKVLSSPPQPAGNLPAFIPPAPGANENESNPEFDPAFK
ncbi:conserved hypothetical protein [Planctopirus limnophila DSM 3776]|uniref:Outer membrane efflux protein n=1 Tax=Planctopirus limnophila (strain ATCC 43296 / DSM 3776 / IFAM 1008 / Mu 290) TaxID=521674 RepID=D5SMM3_PLAL2|nr:TolC family protein [Planctopirus limnophila]ADG65943.1 conserved hypothetical protein [Planctopirus limnophila DSM 3776]